MGPNKNKLALAAALTMSIAYLVCVIFVAMAPVFSLRLLGWLTHLVNTDKFAVAITAKGFIAGLLEVFVYTYIVIWVFAALYRRFNKPMV